MFGMFNHISFPNGGDPQDEGYSHIETAEGCATVSDSSGNLLFYSEGVNCWAYKSGTGPSNIGRGFGGMGGSRQSAHSAIIVPPAGGGGDWHLFTTGSVDDADGVGSIEWTPVTYSSGYITPGSTRAVMPNISGLSSEHLSAYPHMDVDKYWVVSINYDTNEFVVFLVDQDDWGTAANLPSRTFVQPYGGNAGIGFCMKFSQAGDLLAVTNHDEASIDLFKFNRATGQLTPHYRILGIHKTSGYSAYGIEFSPDGSVLYYTNGKGGRLHKHIVQPASGTAADVPEGPVTTPVIFSRSITGFNGYILGGLQLGPNGKIYGVKSNLKTLFVIGDPNNFAAPAFDETAKDNSGADLITNDVIPLGLPTFTLQSSFASVVDGGSADPNNGCEANPCDSLIEGIEDQLLGQSSDNFRHMATCSSSSRYGRRPSLDNCVTPKIHHLKPKIHIGWGASASDKIESEDIEKLLITICNPYEGVTYCDLKFASIEILKADGSSIDLLPNGRAAIEITPKGPYHFGDVPSCSCKSREFILQTNMALPAEYNLKINGLCFDAKIHKEADACFKFEVSPD